jgi:hypothetical protein
MMWVWKCLVLEAWEEPAVGSFPIGGESAVRKQEGLALQQG